MTPAAPEGGLEVQHLQTSGAPAALHRPAPLLRAPRWERWRGPTFVRQGGTVLRTPAEDDGVMVLRFGPSRSIDLNAAICCEARQGDDW